MIYFYACFIAITLLTIAYLYYTFWKTSTRYYRVLGMIISAVIVLLSSGIYYSLGSINIIHKISKADPIAFTEAELLQLATEIKKYPEDTDIIMQYIRKYSVSHHGKLDNNSKQYIQTLFANEEFDNENALYNFLALDAYQSRDFNLAIEHWTKVLPKLDDNTHIKSSIIKAVESAKKQLTN